MHSGSLAADATSGTSERLGQQDIEMRISVCGSSERKEGASSTVRRRFRQIARTDAFVAAGLPSAVRGVAGWIFCLCLDEGGIL